MHTTLTPQAAAEVRRLAKTYIEELLELVDFYLTEERDLTTHGQREKGMPGRLIAKSELPRFRRRLGNLRREFAAGPPLVHDALVSLVRLFPGATSLELGNRLRTRYTTVRTILDGLEGHGLVYGRGRGQWRQFYPVESKGKPGLRELQDRAENRFRTTPAR